MSATSDLRNWCSRQIVRHACYGQPLRATSLMKSSPLPTKESKAPNGTRMGGRLAAEVLACSQSRVQRRGGSYCGHWALNPYCRGVGDPAASAPSTHGVGAAGTTPHDSPSSCGHVHRRHCQELHVPGTPGGALAFALVCKAPHNGGACKLVGVRGRSDAFS